MDKTTKLNLTHIITLLGFLLIGFISNAQVFQIEVVGGAVISEGETVTINAGASLDFSMTNIDGSNCNNLKIEHTRIANTTDFNISPNDPKGNIKHEDCRGGNKEINFNVENLNSSCATTSTLITVEIKNQADFTFTLEVNSSPVISVLGGSPQADIFNGATITSATNGTHYGVVEESASVTRNFIIVNTGSCPLDISNITSSLGDFVLAPYMLLPNYTPTFFTTSIAPGSFVIFIVTFTGPVAGSGTLTSTISISNTDNTTFTFDVSAEMFNFNIPGPGGVTADFRLWLKSTRGIVKTGPKVSLWKDLGSNGKNASQTDSDKQPDYLDTPTDNINFNPVIKFENNGTSIEEYLENTNNGFYSQDIFIVMVPDATMTNASSRNTIFGGLSTGNSGDITGVGFGDYSSEFTNETLSYNQDVDGGSTYNGEAELNSTYSNAGIINVRNNAATSPTGQDILYNSNVLTTSTVNDIAFANVGYIDTDPDPDIVYGTEYRIGSNVNIQGSLNGRVAEVFTFAERVNDTDRHKIESYLAIKYGITLGASQEAQKDYINSFNTKVWDIAANSGYNYHVAGIGKDSISDLNQKQSKTLNTVNEVTIGLGGVATKNSANTNEFKEDGDFLVWGSNNAAYSGSNTNTVAIASGITTSLTRIDRKWKIIESTETSSDVEKVFVQIPTDAFSGFSLGTDEEYALIVSDSDAFANSNIVDVIPLKSDGASNLQTWYDFSGTSYFTFGKVSKFSGNHSISIASGDYLVGEYALNLNINAFTISAWVKSASSANTRTIMAKGSKLQLRLNGSDKIEVMLDNDVTPRFTSTMALNDGKWHQISFVYKSGTIFLYVDGVLDKSEQNVEPPTPNYNHFSVGAVYIDKDNIINPLLGEIDEIYVWDQELTRDQVRYLMNQEIEKVTGDFVSGKAIPAGSASNEVASIPWSKLKAYYNFNSFYGSTVEGQANARNFLRLKYLNTDKTIIDAQTIPMSYVSAQDGTWDDPATWVNSADVMLPNALSLNGVTYIDWNIVDLSHNITSGDRDISVLGLKSNAGTLTIADPSDPQNETNSGQGLTISHYLELDGVIDLVGESQLVQSEGSIVDADSGGYILRDQQGTANSFNYNYWSSSVGPITGNAVSKGTGISQINSNYTISGVLNDGTISASYQPITFSSSYSAADSATPSNPRTISSYWLYKFYGPHNDFSSWQKINQASSLSPGEGFTMKGTSGSIAIESLQNYAFKGIPNNGDISLALDKSSGNVNRLIGNPYPSAIDAVEFILDNLSAAAGGNNSVNVFDGSLYFWDHFGQTDSHILGDYIGGYATYNFLGGAPAIYNALTSTKTPGPYIPVNQGFFVTTSGADGGTVVFKNSQRVFVQEAVGISVFNKTSHNNKNTSSSNAALGTIPLIRLTYDSPLDYHREIVIGADINATNGFDFGYDAIMADVNQEDMYWTLGATKLVIQGVNNFNVGQEFPLGVIVKTGGLATIRISFIENIPPTKDIFILDTSTGTTFRINDTPFQINLGPGTYTDRFKLVFESQSGPLSIKDVKLNNKLLAYYDSKTSELKMNMFDNTEILDVNLFNINGQLIKSLTVNSNAVSIPLNVSTGVYIVKVTTINGVINKKIIID